MLGVAVDVGFKSLKRRHITELPRPGPRGPMIAGTVVPRDQPGSTHRHLERPGPARNLNEVCCQTAHASVQSRSSLVVRQLDIVGDHGECVVGDDCTSRLLIELNCRNQPPLCGKSRAHINLQRYEISLATPAEIRIL